MEQLEFFPKGECGLFRMFFKKLQKGKNPVTQKEYKEKYAQNSKMWDKVKDFFE